MPGSSFFYMLIVPEGRSLEKAEEKVRVYNHRVSPNLLQKMGITLLKGRHFTEQDDAGHPLVSIVSRSAAEALWPQDPIGKRFWVGAPQEGWAEVVGVAADIDQRGRVLLDHDFRRDVYFPLFQMRARTASILLQTRGHKGPTGEQLNDLMRTIAPDVPVYDVKTLQERRREEAGTRLNAFLLISTVSPSRSGLAGAPSPFHGSLHANQCLVAEYGRALLPGPDAEPTALGSVSQCWRPDYSHRRVPGAPQPRSQALHLDEVRQRYPEEGHPCPPSS